MHISSTNHVLVAGENPHMRSTLRSFLPAPDFDLLFCGALSDAIFLLQERRVDAILCGVQFDGIRLFDLLEYVETHSSTKLIPFIVLNMMDDTLAEPMVDQVIDAAIDCGAIGSLDLTQSKRRSGEPEPGENLRKLLSCLAAAGIVR